jgi:hypothetical protein
MPPRWSGPLKLQSQRLGNGKFLPGNPGKQKGSLKQEHRSSSTHGHRECPASNLSLFMLRALGQVNGLILEERVDGFLSQSMRSLMSASVATRGGNIDLQRAASVEERAGL